MFFIAVTLSNCDKKQNIYGVMFNAQRLNIGLVLLDSTWEYAKSYTSDGGMWINPIKEENLPYYFKKHNLIEKNKIIWETDEYLGKNTYMTIDGNLRESLCITYYFNDKRWEYVFCTAKKMKPNAYSNHPEKIKGLYYETSFVISKMEADSILSSWNLLITR